MKFLISIYFQINYIDGTDATLTPQAIAIPDCGSPCLFDDFKTNSVKFTNVTGDNYNTVCQS